MALNSPATPKVENLTSSLMVDVFPSCRHVGWHHAVSLAHMTGMSLTQQQCHMPRWGLASLFNSNLTEVQTLNELPSQLLIMPKWQWDTVCQLADMTELCMTWWCESKVRWRKWRVTHSPSVPWYTEWLNAGWGRLWWWSVWWALAWGLTVTWGSKSDQCHLIV